MSTNSWIKINEIHEAWVLSLSEELERLSKDLRNTMTFQTSSKILMEIADQIESALDEANDNIDYINRLGKRGINENSLNV